jgi:hypothetical protein
MPEASIAKASPVLANANDPRDPKSLYTIHPTRTVKRINASAK